MSTPNLSDIKATIERIEGLVGDSNINAQLQQTAMKDISKHLAAKGTLNDHESLELFGVILHTLELHNTHIRTLHSGVSGLLRLILTITTAIEDVVTLSK